MDYFSFHILSYFSKINSTPNTNNITPVIPSIVRFTFSFLKNFLSWCIRKMQIIYHIAVKKKFLYSNCEVFLIVYSYSFNR